MADLRIPRTELDIDTDTGTWAVRSAGPTLYVLDLDTRPARCLRVPGRTSARGATDHTWATVMDLRAIALDGTMTRRKVRVGCRTYWYLDPGPHHPDLVWWLQRLVTSITTYPPELPRDHETE